MNAIHLTKTICPKCGAQLTLESIGEYGILYKVKKNGELCRRTRKKDHGTMEFCSLHCDKCGWQAHEQDFFFDGATVELALLGD